MKTVNRSVQASAPLKATVSCCSCHDPFNKKMEGDLCVWQEDETQRYLLVVLL